MRVVTFGELMLRLSTPKGERVLQSPSFDATFGGGDLWQKRVGDACLRASVVCQGAASSIRIGCCN